MESWHFWKLENRDSQRLLLESGLGLPRREEWMKKLRDDDAFRRQLNPIWQAFFCGEMPGCLSMVACEAPEQYQEGMPVWKVRERKRELSHKEQRKITALAGQVGMGVFIQYQLSSKKRREIAVDHPDRPYCVGQFVLTPRMVREQKHNFKTPTTNLVRLGLAPLLPAAL